MRRDNENGGTKMLQTTPKLGFNNVAPKLCQAEPAEAPLTPSTSSAQ